MSGKKIKVAIIGGGLIGKKRADAISLLDKFELLGVLDENAQVANKFAKDHSCKVYPSLEEILSDVEVDLVIVAIVHKFAAQIAPKILVEKNILIEKPAGRNSAETSKNIKAAERSGNKMFVGFNYRFYPHVIELQKLIQKQTLGKIISSTFRIGHAAAPGYEKTWKMDKDLCGGGVVLDPGVHLLDLTFFLLGAPEKIEVVKNNLGWGGQVEDEAFLTLNFSNKSFSTHHYSLNFAKNTFFVEIVGSKGVVRISGRGGNYGEMTFEFVPRWFWQGKKIIKKNFGSEDNSFRDELKNVALEIGKNQTKNYLTFEEEMKIVDKIYSS